MHMTIGIVDLGWWDRFVVIFPIMMLVFLLATVWNVIYDITIHKDKYIKYSNSEYIEIATMTVYRQKDSGELAVRILCDKGRSDLPESLEHIPEIKKWIEDIVEEK